MKEVKPRDVENRSGISVDQKRNRSGIMPGLFLGRSYWSAEVFYLASMFLIFQTLLL